MRKLTADGNGSSFPLLQIREFEEKTWESRSLEGFCSDPLGLHKPIHFWFVQTERKVGRRSKN